MADLLEMLTYKRPAGSSTEEKFINRYIRLLDPYEDGYGNLWLQVGEHPNILWSIHTDTVHRTEGRQNVYVDEHDVIRVKLKNRKGQKMTNCLGADDTVGVWLALEMIEAKVPGLYVFHREEEIGGGGSIFAAKYCTSMLEGIDCAIALDRAGYSDVITHQTGDRCCSDEFAQSLAAILGGEYQPCDEGVFTDTANYTDVIGECTNISVGYFRQHGPTEFCDLQFIQELRDVLCQADFSSLVFKRRPGEKDPRYPTLHSYWRPTSSYTSLASWIRLNPSEAADFLEFMGYDLRDLELWKSRAYNENLS